MSNELCINNLNYINHVLLSLFNVEYIYIYKLSEPLFEFLTFLSPWYLDPLKVNFQCVFRGLFSLGLTDNFLSRPLLAALDLSKEDTVTFKSFSSFCFTNSVQFQLNPAPVTLLSSGSCQTHLGHLLIVPQIQSNPTKVSLSSTFRNLLSLCFLEDFSQHPIDRLSLPQIQLMKMSFRS